MFIIYGRRAARIKKYSEQQHACPHCKTFDLTVRVYGEYFHAYYIPAFPVGMKTAVIHCNQCGNPLSSQVVSEQYEKASRTPIYFFTFPLLVAVLIGFIINANMKSQKEKSAMINDPKSGDIYKIRTKSNEKTAYYFLQVTSVDGDTVRAYHNNLIYTGVVDDLNDEDFFDQGEELMYLKPELRKMLEDDEIDTVDRDHGHADSSNRSNSKTKMTR